MASVRRSKQGLKLAKALNARRTRIEKSPATAYPGYVNVRGSNARKEMAGAMKRLYRKNPKSYVKRILKGNA